jgi:hypothetical protein
MASLRPLIGQCYGKRNVHAAIKNHLWQATRRGLLERSPGRAGGKTTAKAKNLIAPEMGLKGLLDS